ncbi:MFS transporter [Actinoplanes sp. NPDC051851]|uniref:MFS transporter n=1 Tax=Actinoplanes sp. NPDC051851 TaxID=3154753 RepID=UPI003418849A
MAELTRTDLPRSVRWGYGGGEWANAVMWTALSALFLYYLTDVVGVDPAFGGTLLLIGTLWNTVLQPYVGLRSDRHRSPHGRRRPFLLAAALPYGLSSWLLFTDPGFTGAARTVYYTVVVLAWYTSFTVFYIPYSALGAELSGDHEERTRLSSVRTAASQLGAMVGAVAPLVLHDPLAGLLGLGEKAGWSAAAAVCALLSVAGLLLTWRTARGHEGAVAEPASPGWRDTVGMLRTRDVRLMLGMLAFGWVPLSVTGTVSVYFGVHIMGYSEQTASLEMLCWFVAGLAWLPVVYRCCHRYGKNRTFVLFTATWAIVQALLLIPERGDDTLFWALILLSSAGSMAVAVVGWSMLADLTDVEQLRTGERREGALNGLSAFAQTGLAAVVVWLASLALSAAGYDGDGAPGATASLVIRLLMSVGTALWLIPAVICCLRYPVTRERHEAVLRELRGLRDH